MAGVVDIDASSLVATTVCCPCLHSLIEAVVAATLAYCAVSVNICPHSSTHIDGHTQS